MGSIEITVLRIGVQEDSPGVNRLQASFAERLLRDRPRPRLGRISSRLLRLGDTESALDLLEPYAADAERLGDPLAGALGAFEVGSNGH